MADARYAAYPVTPAMVHRLPAHFSRVRLGMTAPKVWKALDLPPSDLPGRGSGPPQAFATVYWIGPYSLGLAFDDTAHPARLMSFSLHRNPPPARHHSGPR